MQAVVNLLGEYCDRMDGGDFDDVGALIRRGALCEEHGTVLAEGAQAGNATQGR